MQSSTATVRWRGVISEADPAGDWPHRLAGRAAWRRHCPSGEGARRGALQWRRFGNGLTAALDLHAVRAISRPWLSRLRAPAASTGPLARGVDKREVRQLRSRILPGATRTSGCRRGRAQPGGARPSAGQGSRAQRRVRWNFEPPRPRHGMRVTFAPPRPPTGPVALRGGRHGAATAPPARGPGAVRSNGVGSAMASPPLVCACVLNAGSRRSWA